ncbi:MAG: energy-coupling factor transporter transmembrane component T [Eubacteriales bacterium]|nr:energy-coupling factor transporter transmembrane component T [Eubacteriales bacterium]
MIRDITLGQYYPGNSVIHSLDARVKIVSTVLFIVELFVVNSFIGFGFCAAAVALVVAVSRVPISYILRGLKPIFLILAFTFLLNLFMVDGRVIMHIWIFKVTEEGLYVALFMAIRLVLLIISSSLLTLTTKPIALTDGLEKLMSPLQKVGVPTHDIAMMISIALRFIPTLLDEADKIMKAQQARGADFESGNIIQRAKSLIPILIPLFVSAFRIAQDLAMAMEARCYRGGDGRTRLHPMQFRQRDLAAGIGIAVFFAWILVLRIFF